MQGAGASEEAFEGEGGDGGYRGQKPLEVIGGRLNIVCDEGVTRGDEFICDWWRGGQVWIKLVDGKDGDVGGLGLVFLFTVVEVKEVLGRHTKVELEDRFVMHLQLIGWLEGVQAEGVLVNLVEEGTFWVSCSIFCLKMLFSTFKVLISLLRSPNFSSRFTFIIFKSFISFSWFLMVFETAFISFFNFFFSASMVIFLCLIEAISDSFSLISASLSSLAFSQALVLDICSLSSTLAFSSFNPSS